MAKSKTISKGFGSTTNLMTKSHSSFGKTTMSYIKINESKNESKINESKNESKNESHI